MLAALRVSYMNTVLICVPCSSVSLCSMLRFHRNGILDIRRLFLSLCNVNEAYFQVLRRVFCDDGIYLKAYWEGIVVNKLKNIPSSMCLPGIYLITIVMSHSLFSSLETLCHYDRLLGRLSFL